jgi:hypothetical protein
MMSSSSFSSPIIRARPQHLKKAREPSYRASLILVCRNIVAVAKANYHHHMSPRRLLFRPFSTHNNLFPRQASSSPDEPLESHLTIFPVPEPHHHRALLVTDPVRPGNSLSTRFPPQPRLPQGLP